MCKHQKLKLYVIKMPTHESSHNHCLRVLSIFWTTVRFLLDKVTYGKLYQGGQWCLSKAVGKTSVSVANLSCSEHQIQIRSNTQLRFWGELDFLCDLFQVLVLRHLFLLPCDWAVWPLVKMLLCILSRIQTAQERQDWNKDTKAFVFSPDEFTLQK